MNLLCMKYANAISRDVSYLTDTARPLLNSLYADSDSTHRRCENLIMQIF
jgi:hypothetical protein